jgi:hypothetical protein
LTLSLVSYPATTLAEQEQEQEQEQEAKQRVRVPKSHANVHLGPTTARPVLVLVAKDTVLSVVGRRGEWFEVELPPELRHTGMVMRWYRNEERGWVHQSTVELVED